MEVGEIELHPSGWHGELYIDESRRPCPLVRYSDIAYFGPFRTPWLALLAVKRAIWDVGGTAMSESLRMT